MKFSLPSILYLALGAHGHILKEHNDHDHHHHVHGHDHNHSDRELQDGGRTCGYVEPDDEELQRIERDIQKFKEKGGVTQLADQVIEIDVYFHIFTSTSGQGAIPEEKVLKQIDILNDAFKGVESSYSECSGFTYEPMTVTPFHFNLVHLETIADNAAYNLDSSASDTIRAGLRKGDCSDLNVFTGSTSFLGWAYFPSICPVGGDHTVVGNQLDSINLLWSSLPEMGSNPYDEGDTATHEVGHWLGLFHTFQGGCFGGDQVADTPAEASSAFGCPIGRDTCSAAGVDPIHNYMDYTDDCCMYTFTEGQNERMIAQAGLYRGLFPVNINPTVSPAPTSAPTPCQGDAIAVTIVTDDWPTETGWTLTDDCSGLLVDSKPAGFYGADFTEYVHEICAPESDTVYTFTITDSWGDGICCGYGDGSYEVTLNGEVVASGGNFGSSESTTFGAEDCSPGNCVDSDLLVPVQGSFYSCAQIVNNDGCSIAEAAMAHCPLGCDACEAYGCEDSSAPWQLFGSVYNCAQLAALDPSESDIYCESFGLELTCRETCGYC